MKKLDDHDEWITTQYIIPLTRWQKLLNIFLRALGKPILGETVVIHSVPWKPFGLLTDGQHTRQEDHAS